MEEPLRGAGGEALAHPTRVDRLAAEQHVLHAGERGRARRARSR